MIPQEIAYQHMAREDDLGYPEEFWEYSIGRQICILMNYCEDSLPYRAYKPCTCREFIHNPEFMTNEWLAFVELTGWKADETLDDNEQELDTFVNKVMVQPKINDL